MNKIEAEFKKKKIKKWKMKKKIEELKIV